MVRFIHLKIRNANPFKEVDLNFERKGLVRIVGRNGAGKSSLWHLMTFLYYGLNPNKATKNEIAMDTKDFLIEGSFIKEDTRYWCATAVKSKCHNPLGEPYGTGYFLFKKTEAGWENISWHKAADTQKLVKDLLGWSIEEWYGYVYLAQQTSHTLINGTPSERQKYLSALFNLEPLDVIADHYRKKALAEADKIQDIEKKQAEITLIQNMMTVEKFRGRGPEEIEKAIEEIKFNIEDKTFLIGEADEEQKRYDDLHALCQEFSVLVPDDFAQTGRAQLDAAQTELERHLGLQAQHKAIFDQHAALKQKADQVGPRLRRLSVAKMYDDYEQVMASPDISLAESEKKLKELRNVEGFYRSPHHVTAMLMPEPLPADHETILGYSDLDLLRTKSEIAKIKGRAAPPAFERPETEDMDELLMAASNASGTITFLHDRRAQLMMEGKCPTCGTELNAEHREKELARVNAEMDAAEREKKIVNVQLNELTGRRNAWDQYDKLGPDRSGELPELEMAVSRYEEKVKVRVLVQKRTEWDKYNKDLEAIREIPELEQQIAAYKKKDEYRKLADQLKERDLLKVQYDEMLVDLKALEEKLATILYDPFVISALKEKIDIYKEALAIGQKIDVLAATEPQDTTDHANVMRADLTELQTKLGEAKAYLTELNDLIERLRALTAEISGAADVVREQKKCEILAKAYGKAGKIRQGQLSKFTGYLRDALTCHTFQQLPNHRITFDVDDGIGINTSKDGCRPYDISHMSGGEKGAMSGAFLFALDDLLPPDRKTSLKVIDELESAFDADRKQSFFDYTLEELRRRAETVIVISHTPIDDQSLFDRTWEVKDGKVNDISGEIRSEHEFGESALQTNGVADRGTKSDEPDVLRPVRKARKASTGRVHGRSPGSISPEI